MVIVLAGGVPQRKTEQEELLLWKMSRFIEYNLRWFMKQILNDANIKLLHFFLRNIRCFRSKLREKRIWKIWNMNINIWSCRMLNATDYDELALVCNMTNVLWVMQIGLRYANYAIYCIKIQIAISIWFGCWFCWVC